MYCATVFCLLVMAFQIPSKPASCIAFFRGGYVHCNLPPLRGCLLVIQFAALCMKLYIARSILEVSTHISAPRSSTACTTAVKKLPDTLLFALSQIKIRDSRP